MSNLLSARGCVYDASGGGDAGGSGWFNVRGLSGTPEAPLLFQGVQLGFASLFQPVIALDNNKFIYTFGKDFGQITVFGEALLGPAGAGSDGIAPVLAFFETNQVAVSKTTIRVSCQQKGYAVYLTGVQVGQCDPDLHIMPFSYNGLIAATVGA